ncbi:MAG: hypothetical protein ACE365_03310 [Gammaproteobacteria bacterium]
MYSYLSFFSSGLSDSHHLLWDSIPSADEVKVNFFGNRMTTKSIKNLISLRDLVCHKPVDPDEYPYFQSATNLNSFEEIFNFSFNGVRQDFDVSFSDFNTSLMWFCLAASFSIVFYLYNHAVAGDLDARVSLDEKVNSGQCELVVDGCAHPHHMMDSIISRYDCYKPTETGVHCEQLDSNSSALFATALVIVVGGLIFQFEKVMEKKAGPVLDVDNYDPLLNEAFLIDVENGLDWSKSAVLEGRETTLRVIGLSLLMSFDNDLILKFEENLNNKVEELGSDTPIDLSVMMPNKAIINP